MATRLNLGTNGFKVRAAVETNVKLLKVYTLHLGKKASFLINNRSNTKLKAGSKGFIISETENLVFKMPKNTKAVALEVYKNTDFYDRPNDLHEFHAGYAQEDLDNEACFNEIHYLESYVENPSTVDIRIKEYEGSFAESSNYNSDVWKFDFWQQYNTTMEDSATIFFKPIYELDKVRVIKKYIDSNLNPKEETVIKTGFSEDPYVPVPVPGDISRRASDIPWNELIITGSPGGGWSGYSTYYVQNHFTLGHGQNPVITTRTFKNEGQRRIEEHVIDPTDGIPTIVIGNVLTVDNYKAEGHWDRDKCCSNCTWGLRYQRANYHQRVTYIGNTTSGNFQDIPVPDYKPMKDTIIGAYYDKFDWFHDLKDGSEAHKQTVTYTEYLPFDDYYTIGEDIIHPSKYFEPEDFGKGYKTWDDVAIAYLSKYTGFSPSKLDKIKNPGEHIQLKGDVLLKDEYVLSRTYSMDFYIRSSKYQYRYTVDGDSTITQVETSRPDFIINHPSNVQIASTPSLMYYNGSMTMRDGRLYEWLNHDSQNGEYFEAEIYSPFKEYAVEMFEKTIEQAKADLKANKSYYSVVSEKRQLKNTYIVEKPSLDIIFYDEEITFEIEDSSLTHE